MPEHPAHMPGIAWIDLTVPNAGEVRDFYAKLLGFRPEPVDMGDYSDYNMVNPASGEPILGVCHKQGPNEDIPPGWILYFTVADLDESIRKAVELGGTIMDGPRGGFCILRDPGGAYTALYQAPADDD